MYSKLDLSEKKIEIYDKISKTISSCFTLKQCEAAENMINVLEDENLKQALIYPLILKKRKLNLENEESKLHSI